MGNIIGTPSGVTVKSISVKRTNTFDFTTDESDIFSSATLDGGKYRIKGLEKPFITLDPLARRDYSMDYNYIDGVLSNDELIDKLNESSNHISGTPMSIFNKNLKYYNRFKLKSVDDTFQKAFPHVFFVRPDLNIFYNNNEDLNRLSTSLENNPLFAYAWRNSKDMMRSLVLNNGEEHTFNMYLSNKVTSFETSDEYIDVENTGKTYLGHQISYGKDVTQSKIAGEININFDDDKYCHTYLINKIWMEYINLVSRGTIAPNPKNILDKILDYAGSIYYIVTAEDGETIIFWSKYYGVFPSVAPSSQMSWNGELLQGPLNYSFKYQYSFKEDYNPFTLVEFNMNTGATTTDNNIFPYVPIFDVKNNTVATTWVGQPFIELCTDTSNPNSGTPYSFKLRFKG